MPTRPNETRESCYNLPVKLDHYLAASATVLDVQGRVLEDVVHRMTTGDPAQGLKLPLPPGTYTLALMNEGDGGVADTVQVIVPEGQTVDASI